MGSWDNYRTEIDAGGPINAAGTVRGRLVTAYQDRHYFYSGTKSKTPLFYGVIDADLGQDTTLTFARATRPPTPTATGSSACRATRTAARWTCRARRR